MSDFTIIDNTEDAKWEFAKRAWGQSEQFITRKDIQALLDGKSIGCDDGEYTTVITLKEEEK